MSNNTHTGWRKKIADEMHKQYPDAMDERTKRISNESLAPCGVIAIAYVVGKIIWEGFHDRVAILEVILLLLFFIVIHSVEKAHNVHSLPKFFGMSLDTHNRKQRIRLYATEALFLAITWGACDFLGIIGSEKSSLTEALCTAGIFFLTVMGFNLLLGEHTVKEYNAAQAALDAEENDLGD